MRAALGIFTIKAFCVDKNLQSEVKIFKTSAITINYVFLYYVPGYGSVNLPNLS